MSACRACSCTRRAPGARPRGGGRSGTPGARRARVPEECSWFAGQGLASRLVYDALTDVRAVGKRVVPVCPYAKKYLSWHDEFSDLADAVTPDPAVARHCAEVTPPPGGMPRPRVGCRHAERWAVTLRKRGTLRPRPLPSGSRALSG
ncbi:GNAT family N-acetyltransferase [Streptomyces sp. NPDC047841]|uniref:GNAT family N-acetyltransferase n=1 Tax=Streptomyces sp. NPDC047841 TaxID=3154708 RepID=UPI0034538358